MDEIERRARELLAAEYDSVDCREIAKRVRSNLPFLSDGHVLSVSIRAIIAALTPAPAVWRTIDSAEQSVEKCLLWCSDQDIDGRPVGTVEGRIRVYPDEIRAYGRGRTGDWTFTHWQPLPPPPEPRS